MGFFFSIYYHQALDFVHESCIKLVSVHCLCRCKQYSFEHCHHCHGDDGRVGVGDGRCDFSPQPYPPVESTGGID